MERKGQITYELNEDAYNSIKEDLRYIEIFLDGDSYYKEDAKRAIENLTNLFK